MTENILKQQKKLYSKPWDEYTWKNEKIYPVLLPIDEVLEGSTARLHTPQPPLKYNVIGTPRCGTMWVTKIVSMLLGEKSRDQRKLFHRLKQKIKPAIRIRHFHEGIIEDYKNDQQIIFIYRDIRDAIVSGYHYIGNNLNPGTMYSNIANFKKLPKEEALRKHIIMYMKYRLPVMEYWLKLKAKNLLIIKYEDLLENRGFWINEINRKTGIMASERLVKNVINETSFSAMSGGRKSGKENEKSHQRRGVSGDWQNHFNNKHVEMFRQMGGEDFLNKYNYKV